MNFNKVMLGGYLTRKEYNEAEWAVVGNHAQQQSNSKATAKHRDELRHSARA
jgi:hypothetical protein